MMTFSECVTRATKKRIINKQMNLMDFSMSREDAINFLKIFLEMYHIREKRYETFDYGKFIFIEMYFKDDTEIKELVAKIKLKIFNEYSHIQKYYERITTDYE